ncbi:TVP38/TMEM64 family protein [Natronococcus wangiae]|uniref:TVP38/TMEM64 family protein n=1 Tax=Natronococcus wangiae TaxID=3068275 RepID=UPI00273EAB7C|nr:VTT domain-containing protein [Natronococcus sp. AD5]
MTSQSASVRALAGALLLAAIATVGVLVPTSTVVDTAESVAGDPILFGLVVVGLYLVRPLALVPTTPLAVVVGYGYGVPLGIPVALVGVVVTVVPVFLVARWLVEGDDRRAAALRSGRIGRLFERTERAVRRYYDTAGQIRGVVASRLAPIPSDVATCAAAVSGVRLRHLVIGTALGELPWTIAAVVVGASAATVTTDGFGDPGLALTVACTLAAALLLAGPIYAHLWEKPQAGDSSRHLDG